MAYIGLTAVDNNQTLLDQYCVCTIFRGLKFHIFAETSLLLNF